MNTGTTRTNEWKNYISGAATAAIGWLTGHEAKAEPSRQRRQRLLSAFLIVMGLMTLSAAVFFKNISASFWTVMLVTSLVLFIGFFISRTRYHQAAVILAITVPAINPLAVFIFKLPEINLLATLMWLSLPLLVSSLMMTIRKTIIVAVGYIAYISLLAFLGPINHDISIPLIAYIVIIAFFVLTISVVREKDQVEMSNELKERQRVEKALRISEDKFRNLFENAKDTIILADTQTGKLVDINAAGCKLLGLPKEKIIGKHQTELHPPELAEKYRQLFQEHIQKGSVITEDIIVQRADGTRIPMDISANVVKLADKTIIQGIFRDMTERKLVEEALIKEQSFSSNVLNSIQDGISVLDSDYNIISVNKAMEKWYPHAMPLAGKKCYEAYQNRKEPCEICPTRRTLENHQSAYELAPLTGEGGVNTGWLDLYSFPIFDSHSGKMTGVIEYVRDMTERKRAEDALKESEERFTKVFRLSPLEICITRIKDGKTVEINDSFTRFTGYTREEIIGRTSTELGIWAKPADRQKMLKVLKKDGRVHNAEFEFRNKHGGIRTYLFSAEPINFNGEECIISIMTDITDRKKTEMSLRESEEKFSKAFHASPQEIIITRAKDNITLEVNDSYTHVTGFTREETIGHTAAEIGVWMKPEDSERLARMLKEQGRVSNEEFEFLNKKGENHTEIISVEPITLSGEDCWISILTDITERKQMEEDLANEAIWRRILIEESMDGIVVLDEDAKVYEANRKFAEMLGYSPEEVYELHTWDWDVKWEPAQLLEMGRLVDSDGLHIETQHRRKDGTIIDVDISINGAVCTGKKLIFCVCRDITERKKMEKAIADEAIWRRILIEQSRDGIVVLDNDGKVYEANHRFAEMMGYSPEELSQMHVWEWGAQGTREQVLEMLRTVNEAGDHFETQHRRKDGTIIDVEISTNGATFHGEKFVFCVCRDITERKKMEQAIRESEEKFSAAFHAIPEAVSIARKRDGIFIDANGGFCRNVGRTIEEVIGHRIEEIRPWANPDELSKMQKIQDKGHFENEEIEIHSKSGDKRTLIISGDVINIGGEPCVLLVGNDITERKKMEQALLESEEKFSKAFHAIPEAISISKLKDGKFIDVNESFCRGKQHTREDLIGHTSEELRLWSKPGERERIIRLIKKNGGIINQELEFGRESGEIQTLLFSAEIINIGGEPCLFTIVNDKSERKKMENALRESEEKFSKAFHAIPDALSLTRMKDGKFIDVNESFCRANGHTVEEAIGHTAEEIGLWVNPEDVDYMNQLMEKQGRVENQEFEFRVKSGEIRTVLLSSDILDINGEPCVLTIGNDITERKRMEQALRESEEKFSKAFQGFTDAVSIASLKGGVFKEVNDSFLSLNGYAREEVIGHTAKELNIWANPEDRYRIKQLMEKGGRFENEEFVLRRKTGETRTALLSVDTINIGGEPYILTIGKDITERKQMEQALRESEEKFSKAFHAIPETLSISTLKEGKFIDVNESFLKLNKLTREKVIGRTGDDVNLLKPGDKRNKLREILNKHSRFSNEEIEFKAKSGKMLTFLFSADTLNIAGEPCLLIIGNDITTRKQAEKNLQNAMADLEKSSAQLQATNKELESFSYSVSHDLRSPLRSIDGFSQALLEDYTAKLDETGQDYLNRLRGASQKMGELIDGLLKLSRLTRSEMHHEKVDLSSLANEIATRLKETFPKRSIEFIIGSDLTANGDPQMLRVLLENLLSNAFKFTKNTRKSRIEFGSKVDGERKTFFIKDNGAGFDMAFRDKLFSAFQRLHDSAEYPGTGIGLATVQRIINRHGGSVSAEGVVGEGATFYFTLN